MYPVLRSCFVAPPSEGSLDGRLPHLKISAVRGLQVGPDVFPFSILVIYMIMLFTISAQLEGVRTRTNPQQVMIMPASFIPVKLTPF